MKSPRYGITELLVILGLSGKPVTTEKLSWILCPAINASGRMGCPDKAVALLLEKDPKIGLFLPRKSTAARQGSDRRFVGVLNPQHE
jgi:single-stranded DNA-specific DHH superfamily exonuclease